MRQRCALRYQIGENSLFQLSKMISSRFCWLTEFQIYSASKSGYSSEMETERTRSLSSELVKWADDYLIIVDSMGIEASSHNGSVATHHITFVAIWLGWWPLLSNTELQLLRSEMANHRETSAEATPANNFWSCWRSDLLRNGFSGDQYLFQRWL